MGSPDVKVRMAPSRALGDFDFKKNDNLSPENQMITAYPDVLTRQISETDEFLVLACDGEYNIPFVEFNSFTPTKASGTVCLPKTLSTSSGGGSMKAWNFLR